VDLVLRDDPGLAPDELRAAVHAGQVIRLSPSAATRGAVAFAAARLAETFPACDPRLAHAELPPDEFLRRLTGLRLAFVEHPFNLPLARSLVSGLGLELARTFLDRLRLRAVPSGAHRDPRAGHAYCVHRDTWYANPPAQINVWVPLHDVTEAESCAFYPDRFEQPVRNDSARFDIEAWQRLGGFQHPHPDKVFPQALDDDLGPAASLAVPEASALLFSGTHLHGTLGHDTGRTRFSLELRLVHADDVAELERRRRLDSRARGSVLPGYLRALDLVPFGDLA
jgi:hypothetical protein